MYYVIVNKKPPSIVHGRQCTFDKIRIKIQYFPTLVTCRTFSIYRCMRTSKHWPGWQKLCIMVSAWEIISIETLAYVLDPQHDADYTMHMQLFYMSFYALDSWKMLYVNILYFIGIWRSTLTFPPCVCDIYPNCVLLFFFFNDCFVRNDEINEYIYIFV